MYFLGVFFQGPNTGAALLHDGQLIAIGEEERFTRVKRASDAFPTQSIRYCLKEAGIRLRDVSVLATAWEHAKYPDYMNDFMAAIPSRSEDPHADSFELLIHTSLSPDLAKFKIKIGMKRIDAEANCEIMFLSHHLCHVASTHYLSGFEESANLVIDGSGEEIATSMWRGDGDDIELMDKWSLPDSLGWFYAALTEYLGFGAYSGEGKVMGLAPYGDANSKVAEKLRLICIPDSDRIYRIDPTYIYHGERTFSHRFTDKLVELLGPPRLPESEISDYHKSIACETQKLLEDIAIDLGRDVLRRSNSRNLCVSGGVAMNCKMNGLLSSLDGVDEIFINPASYDVGAGIGAAFLAAKQRGYSPRHQTLTHAYWGPEFSDKQIESSLDHCKLQYRQCDDISEEVACLLAEGKIVGWFSGRAEFGARALGARSILANPLLPDVKEQVNAHVKYREAFRPFAPSLTEEAREIYLEGSKKSPFMILAYKFAEGYQELFPGVVHVDGTVRPQTVTQEANEPYWRTIVAFGEKTGHPVILNTSFNVRGEPIVNTPLEALRCFFSTGMDAVAIGSYLVVKPNSQD